MENWISNQSTVAWRHRRLCQEKIFYFILMMMLVARETYLLLFSKKKIVGNKA